VLKWSETLQTQKKQVSTTP